MNADAFLKHRFPVAAFFLAVSAAVAAPDPGLDRALEPLESGVPEVAVVKLREQLNAPLEEGVQVQVRTKLAEALLAAGRFEEALKELKEPGVSAPLLEGRANAALKRWEEALTVYGAFYDAHPQGQDSALAALGKAESLRALNRLPEAITALESLTHPTETASLRLAELYLEGGELKKCAALLPGIRPGTPAAEKWKQYVEARLLLAEGHPAYALGRFESLQRDPASSGLTMDLITGALLGMSDSRAQLSGLAAADNVLEQFIWRYPESPRLGEIFAKLDEIYAGEESASDSELQKWAEREPNLHKQRAGFAAYYLSKAYTRAGKRERALRALENYGERFPRHPMLAPALLMQGRLLTEEKKFREAQVALDGAMRASQTDLERAEIEMASATVSFQEGEFVLAATVFRAAGERAPALWERAVFNSALSWLHQGNFSRFLQDYKELSTRVPDSPYRRELILEEGLLQARQGPAHVAQAEATLRQFIHDFRDNPRVAEARIALAELRLAGNDAAGASEVLKVVNETGSSDEVSPSPQALQQSAYLAIFVADAATPRDDEKVAALCQAFLEQYPLAAKRPEVRMKLGQVYFRTGDFAGAQTQFETLAKENSASPLVEAALFLAGQASMKRMSEGAIDRAIELFAEAAKMDGPLKLQVRLQQALAKNRMGKQDEAILLYDAILRADPPAEVRFAALAGKAENLAELGEKDRALSQQALELYTHLAAEPGLGVTWRSQALYQKGRLLEALARPEEALAAYYDVLEAGLAEPEEYYWFYKAGFDAGRLCEAQGQWKSAIGIYRKMAALEGPRAEEAAKSASRLRLEHFIWE